MIGEKIGARDREAFSLGHLWNWPLSFYAVLRHRWRERLWHGAPRIDRELLHRPLPRSDQPLVTILIPLRNVARELPATLANLLKLEHPRQALRILFGHGDSTDQTEVLLRQFIAKHSGTFREVAIIPIAKNAPQIARNERAKRDYQLRRRSGIAAARNELLKAALKREADWILWIDADVTAYPKDILRQLLAEKEKIVVPNCVMSPGGNTFDLNSYLHTKPPRLRDVLPFLTGGLYQPHFEHPIRQHLDDLRYLHRVPLHSVGGTMLLVDAQVHRAGLDFPTLPYRNLIETEAFGMRAHELGVTPIGLPNLEIIHPDR